MSSYRIISTDNHVFEPPDLWLSRIEPKYKDRAPRVVHHDDGSDWWYCDGKLIPGTGVGFGGSQTGERFKEGRGANLTFEDSIDNVRPGGYIPEEHVKDLDIDGIDASINYPTVGLQLFKEPDTELLNSIFVTYNDWLAEFCSAAPSRIHGIGMINVDNVQVGVKEMERCAKMGLAGGMITVRPPIGRKYNSPEYEPLWAAAQDLEMPLGLHLDTNRLGSGEADGSDPTDQDPINRGVNCDHYVRNAIAEIILAGVFERYPKLHVGAVEYEVSWAAHFLERLDYLYTDRTAELVPNRFKNGMLPSDFFHSNVFIGFQEDGLGIRLRDIIGVNSLTWGSDYPHHESTFPRSREILEKILADCTEEEKVKIVSGNAARIYKI